MDFIDRLFPGFPREMLRLPRLDSGDIGTIVFIIGGPFLGMKYEVGYIPLSPRAGMVPGP